jgi:CheY-like chemotaxis protein
LATSLGIIRSHGGFLTLETEEGCGTTFHVFLPAAAVDAVPETPAPFEPARVAQGKGETILVVDDEPTVLKVFQRSLEKSGYRVLTAENGEAGLEIYEAHQSEVRLVLTDLAMPGLDGPALIQELKRRDHSLRIVCTSGLAIESGDRETLGVDAVLTKPCSAREIFQTIRSTLETPVSIP